MGVIFSPASPVLEHIHLLIYRYGASLLKSSNNGIKIKDTTIATGKGMYTTFKTSPIQSSKGIMKRDRGRLRTGTQIVSMGIPYNTRATKRLVILLDGLRGALNPTTALTTHSANTVLKMVKTMTHTNTLMGWTSQYSVKMKDREASRKKNEMIESGMTATSTLKKLRFTIFLSPILFPPPHASD
jgi:hypothetical protein